MSAVLTDNLPLLAGAPNGIKKLRELILELAVRGKLVPQDPSDEPASELLKRIAEEKVRLVAQGKIKKQKPLAGVEEAALPFELPVAWVWARLGEITNFGTTIKKDEIPDDAWVLDLEDIEKDTSRLLQKARFYERNSLSDKNSFAKGDVLYGKLRPYLNKVLVAEDDGFCTTEILPFRCHGPFVAHYFMVALKSPYFLSYVNAKSYGMKMPRLGTEDGRQALFPLPPLAEQHRIVAKVDELMALCDRLEARQADVGSAHVQLVQALLGSLTQASDAEDFAQSWQRLAEHFHALLTTESSIDALKQALLQLAVMGKLVPQDPSDEPASELLKRIAEEKTRLISEEGLRTTARDDVPEAEHYFRLHTGWASCRLGNLARFIDYRGRTPTKTSSGVPLITAKNVRPGFISRDPQEFIADTDYLSWMTRGFPRVGDMLFTTEAPMGNVAIIDIAERFALAQRVICFQLHELETGPFLKLALMSSGFQAQLSDAATGMTATGIKSSRLREIPVPIPPLAEQHRIVAKVDELMALCDQLKARLNQARQVHEHLASALVEQAVA
ncbi:restriction endonuclease subunit S [Pseudomonas monteilii]|uniref:restriction endonuclease subunit S n=1 Tax=Pseudomonas monteilii TaxID=76759 RepID=UPI0015FBE76F|nr:restriction endonuclease subunit S [Pseudomonas monteilii]MBA6092779.1 restriction endonuclease subunit S [Pseudomonas monteilii]MCE1007404.1 restriction endonuclease subunit S [Pseudomonas monteilii]